LEEKAWQMGNMVDQDINRRDYKDDGYVKIPAYQYWNEALHGVARSGAATSFPESKGMSSSWDRQLIFDCATVISDEARIYNNVYQKGLNYWCPTINMARDPRWGRDEENYGEDPFLAGQLAVQFIKGMQGEQTAENPYLKTVACAKHFAANNYEQGRQGSTSFMTEHNLREYYLPAFEMAVKDGGVKSIMSSYNALSTDLNEKNAAGTGWTAKKAWGGKPNAMNDWLLTNILRHEWGFDGYVTSDCAGVSCIYRSVKHFYYGNIYGTYTDEAGDINNLYMAHATADAIKAGNDMNCEFKNRTSVFQTAVQQAIEDGYMTEADLDRALIRVLETRFALGEFDDNCPWRNIAASRLECEDHQAMALKAARESAVLLKNEGGLLPIAADKKVALIGPYANQIMLGDYSGTPTYTTTPFQAFSKKLNFTVTDGTLQAENFSEAVVSKRGAENNNKGAGNLENTAPGDIFLYKNVNFGNGCNSFEMSCGAKSSGLGQVSFILDSKDGTPFLTVSNLDTGGWTKWQTVTATIDPAISGTHDLYVKFSGSNSYVGNYDYFKFFNPAANPLETAGPLYMVETSGSVNVNATEEAISRAVAVAQKADVVVFLGGTNYEKLDSHETGTESHDRFVITLPGNQEEVLKAIYAVNKNVVLVLETNSSVDITWAKENIPAIFDIWYGGQAQGQAICDIIYGDYNPGGKLTSTWYNSLAELPAAADSQFGANGMLEYNIDDWGYTYMYYGKGTGANVARQAAKPMYPFGYGLSYTTFEYANLQPTAATLDAGGEMEVSFTVKNTGVRDGAEVVQLYVDFPNATADHMKRLNRRLVGFERVELKAGEQKTVTIPLKHEQLAFFDDATHTFRVEQGTVNFHVSASSDDDRLSGTIAAGAATVKDTYKSDPSILTAIRDVRRVPAAHQQADTVYDMSGRQFSANANLQKGLYIANGKKIIR
jgi:beta-glucosidase